MQETWVQSLGQEDPLEKEVATHSSTLAWKIPWTEEPRRLQSMGSQRVRVTKSQTRLNNFPSLTKSRVKNGASLVAWMVKNPPAVQETHVPSLGQEDPLEKEVATHSSTLAWKIPWMEKPDRLQSMVSQRVGHDWATSLSLLLPLGKNKVLSL